jgi:hypothetical protein
MANLIKEGRFRDTIETLSLLRNKSEVDYFYTIEKFLSSINNINSNSLKLKGSADYQNGQPKILQRYNQEYIFDEQWQIIPLHDS